MRLSEDNACLQQRLQTMQTQDEYSKDLHKDYKALEEQVCSYIPAHSFSLVNPLFMHKYHNFFT